MKKVLVKNCDYDRYSIALPLKIAIKRHGKSFLFKELEKRHPCFSTGCCTDTHYALRGGRLTAEVTVMERARLSEYRRLNPGRNLYLEDEPSFAVFKTQGEKIKVAALFFLLLMGGASLMFVNRNIYGSSKNAVQALADSGAAKIENSTETDSVLLAPTEIFSSVFSSIKNAGGKITSFVWKNGEASMNIRGCNIEEIAGARNCVVSYKNDEPCFSLVLQTPTQKKNHSATAAGSVSFSPEKQLAEFEKTMFVPQIRTMLRTENVELVSEYRSEDFVELSFSVKNSSLAKALKYCAGLSSGNGWQEDSLSILGGENSCAVKVSFVPVKKIGSSQTDFENSPLMQAFLFAEIFIPEEKCEPIPLARRARSSASALQRVPVIKAEKSENPTESDSQGKIGEIRRKDGSVFVYYRNKHGQFGHEVKKEASNE